MTAQQPRTEANDPNLALAKAMGSKKGYDPMPPDQHQWQRARHEPMIHRIWSVLCAATIRARYVNNRLVRTPYATLEDGKTELTIQKIASILEEDDGNVRRAWRLGEQKGLWRKDGRYLRLVGEITAEQVTEANERRSEVCTDTLSSSDLLKIKTWPLQRQREFLGAWKDFLTYRNELIAAKVAEGRGTCYEIEHSMRVKFGLPKPGKTATPRPAVELPQALLPFVQTGFVENVRTDSENDGESVDVQTGPSLLTTEKSQRGVGVGRSVVVEGRKTKDRPTDQTSPEALKPLAKMLREEVPNETASASLLREIHETLDGTPPSYLRTKIQAAIAKGKFKSLGLAVHLAQDAATEWRAGEERRREAERKRLAEEAEAVQRLADAEKEWRALLDDPNSDELDRKIARMVLGIEDKGEPVFEHAHAAGGGK